MPPRLWVLPEWKDSARDRLSESGLPAGAPYAVVHPFGSTPRQWWPLDRVTPLARGLLGQHGLRTIVVGGPETTGRLPDAGDAPAMDVTGKLSIPELLAVIEGAARVITTDSGPFHVAGAGAAPRGVVPGSRPEHAARYPGAAVAFGRDSACESQCAWDRCRSVPCRQMAAPGVGEVLAAIAEDES